MRGSGEGPYEEALGRREVKMLAMFNIPKVLVSATLPPVLLPRLLKAYWISEVTEIRVPVTLNLADRKSVV